MRSFKSLTKFGIVIFVLLSGTIGYVLGAPLMSEWDWTHFSLFLLGLYLISSGSFAINQAQEWRIDIQMPRTAKRPIPTGEISATQAYLIGLFMVGSGMVLLYLVNPLASLLGGLTVLLYNASYTLYWKRKWVFGAVPGAIPGAMPVVIGFAAQEVSLLSPECIYLFLVMFLWQMPHFWSLAIRFKDDYRSGGIPVPPVAIGVEATLYHMGLYMIAYIGVAMAAPMFLKVHLSYLLVVVPLCLKLAYEFALFFRARGQARWLSFFLWTNFSVLAFMGAPLIDRWVTL